MEKQNAIQIVKDCYLEIFSRVPDDVGLKHYSEQLQNNNIDKLGLIEILQDSEESQILKMKKFEKKFLDLRSNKSKEDIQKIFQDNASWYHWMSINGIEISDTRTSKAYQMWVSQNIPNDLTNKTVLDIGCADGFYSYLCESRNAKKVVAIDLESFDSAKLEKALEQNPNNFEILKEILESEIEYKKLSIYNIEELDQKFDYILMYGIYYHLKDLVLALTKVSNIVTDSVFLSGHILDTNEPIMQYNLDPNSQFTLIMASSNCLINIAKSFCQFKTAELIDTITVNYTPTKDYPQNPNSTTDKIGLFKFSK